MCIHRTVCLQWNHPWILVPNPHWTRRQEPNPHHNQVWLQCEPLVSKERSAWLWTMGLGLPHFPHPSMQFWCLHPFVPILPWLSKMLHGCPGTCSEPHPESSEYGIGEIRKIREQWRTLEDANDDRFMNIESLQILYNKVVCDNW